MAIIREKITTTITSLKTVTPRIKSVKGPLARVSAITAIVVAGDLAIDNAPKRSPVPITIRID